MLKENDKISIVIPCYNEEDVLLSFYEEVKKVMQIAGGGGAEISGGF